MNLLKSLKKCVSEVIQGLYGLSDEQLKAVQVALNVDKPRNFGDMNCNAAMMLAKPLAKAPREIAQEIMEAFEGNKGLMASIKSIEIAGPGFLNLHLKDEAWQTIAQELFCDIEGSFKLNEGEEKKKFLLEFVSANPTGPLHLGHGRGGIIGDVLANILTFLGHTADREYYINDAGNQIAKLGRSLKIRCQQEVGQDAEFPEDGYAGDYLVDIAKQCITHYGKEVVEKENTFFEDLAKEQLLEKIKETLTTYGITFDRWFSEKRLHTSGAIEEAIEILRKKELVYEKDDATWFKATDFGDDKDRVIRKADGTLTYIAADIAYHKEKFDREYNVLVDVLGQDHHSYATRLKATMQAIDYDADNLDVILYQLVSIKHKGEQVRMSKRAGTFEKLGDVIEQVGTDVARFFYLNRKADAHLEFDMDVALKKTEENPVYYIQYGYVRTNSLLAKASEEEALKSFVDGLRGGDKATMKEALGGLDEAEIMVLKKICALESLLIVIANNYQTHLLSYYTLELAQQFHSYYAKNKIIDLDNIQTTKARLLLTTLIQQTLALCLELLGLTKPERM